MALPTEPTPDWLAVGQEVGVFYYGRMAPHAEIRTVARHTPTQIVLDDGTRYRLAWTTNSGSMLFRRDGTGYNSTAVYLARADDPEFVRARAVHAKASAMTHAKRAAFTFDRTPTVENARHAIEKLTAWITLTEGTNG